MQLVLQTWGVLIVACLILPYDGNFTVDHASLLRRSTVHTLSGDTYHIWARTTFIPCIT